MNKLLKILLPFINPRNSNKVYRIDMGKEIGTSGERHLNVIIKAGTDNEIITAYPIK